MQMDRKTLLSQFIGEANRREIQGTAQYGRFDPKTDTRILSREAIDETTDCFNYCRFLLKKHPHLREQIVGVMRLAFRAYVELRKLEQDELQLTPKGG